MRKIQIAFAILLAHLLMGGQALAQEPAAEPVTSEVVSDEAAVEQEETAVQPDALVDPGLSVSELSHLLVPLTAAELEGTALGWRELVRAKTQEIADLQAERARDPQAENDARIATIVSLVEERARLLERYTLVVDSLERKGGDEALVTELRAYRQAILFEETSLASTSALVGSVWAWFGRSDGGIALLKRIGIALLAFLAIIFVARLVRGFSSIWISRFTKVSKLLQGFIAGAIFWLMIIFGIVVVLASIDVDITPLFALIGGASFILAFAFQDTLGNLASGLMIMVNQPFDEGDYIEVGGVGGTVKKVSIVGTTIATPDNRIIVVPNKNVWGNVIVNATASDIRRVDLVFGASYDDKIQDVLELLENEVGANPKVLSEPQPDIRANELAASSVNFVCRPWVKSEDYWDVYCGLTARIKEAFEERGLTMPYPQQDVHIKALPEGAK